MKLFLIYNGRMPGEKAASLFAAKSAEAFAQTGFDVTLVVPRRYDRTNARKSVFDYYSIDTRFRVRYIPTIDVFSVPVLSRFRIWQRLAFWLEYVTFTLGIALYATKRSHINKDHSDDTVWYSNEWLPLWVLGLLIPRAFTFYEMHDFPESMHGLFGRVFRRMKVLLIHNQWKAFQAEKTFGINHDNVFVRVNPVETEKFNLQISKEEARKKLGLPLGARIAVYTGHLYGWKGVDTLARAALQLDSSYKVYFVGGTPHDTESFAKKFSGETIVMTGHRQHQEIPLWQKAADVLVLPNTAKEAISLYYTSPMKLFEYMASKRPIIASRIPSITEIVNDSSALLVEPDNAFVLADAIRSCFNPATSTQREKMIANAFQAVKDNTWKNRAKEIRKFIEKHMH